MGCTSSAPPRSHEPSDANSGSVVLSHARLRHQESDLGIPKFSSIGWDEQGQDPLEPNSDPLACNNSDQATDRSTLPAPSDLDAADAKSSRHDRWSGVAAPGTPDGWAAAVCADAAHHHDPSNEEGTSPTLQFLSRASIAEAVEVEGFAKAAAIARERRQRRSDEE